MKDLSVWICTTALFIGLNACSNEQTTADVAVHPSSKTVVPPSDNSSSKSNYDAEKGTGSFTNVSLSSEPDAKKAIVGKALFESTCSSCHRLTEEAIGGPGLKGVTKNFKPEWVLNVITNTNQMMQLDPRLKSKAEFYQVKMPQLGLNEEQALSIYEYLRTADVN